jgi:hypothetical protein
MKRVGHDRYNAELHSTYPGPYQSLYFTITSPCFIISFLCNHNNAEITCRNIARELRVYQFRDLLFQESLDQNTSCRNDVSFAKHLHRGIIKKCETSKGGCDDDDYGTSLSSDNI